MIPYIILFYFLANSLYMYFAPPVNCTGGSPFWDAFFYMAQYGLLFGLGYYTFMLSWHTIDKYFAIALMIYAFCFFIFNVFLINKDLPTYLSICNSKEASLVFTGIVFVLIVLVLIFYYVI
jgi:hypothetical protein